MFVCVYIYLRMLYVYVRLFVSAFNTEIVQSSQDHDRIVADSGRTGNLEKRIRNAFKFCVLAQ